MSQVVGPITVMVSLRTNPLYWPAIVVWALVPGFGWLGALLVQKDLLHG